MYKNFMAVLTVAFAGLSVLTSCSDDDGPEAAGPGSQWSATMRGDGEVIGAYPDLYSNYWEYTYDLSRHGDKVLR